MASKKSTDHKTGQVYSFGQVVTYAKLYSELMELSFFMERPEILRASDPARDIKDLASSAINLIELYKREVPKEVRSRFDAQEDSLYKRCCDIIEPSGNSN